MVGEPMANASSGLSKAIAFRIFIPAYIELYTQGYFPFDKPVKFYILGQTNQDQASEDSEKGMTH